jgi:sensor histidine kinase regulating citrate/malate metabolism
MNKTKHNYFFRFLTTMRLLDRVIIVILSLIILLLVATSIVFSNMMFDFIRIQTEKLAIQTAKNIAGLPALHQFVANEERHPELQHLLLKFSLNTDAAYIAIANKAGTLIAHSHGELSAKELINPYLHLSLEKGSSYVYRYTQNSKRFISGNAPIVDGSENIIGLVSIGYPVDNAMVITRTYLENSIFHLFLFIIIGLGASIIIAKGVKSAIFGLEPGEIATLFQVRTAIIESIRAGVLATDNNGIITLANSNAENMLELKKEELTAQPIERLFSKRLIHRALHDGICIYDAEKTVQGVVMICNIVPLTFQDTIQGVVVTFSKKDEIDLIANELSQATRYSEILRAQTHEYSNRLHAIAGMIQTQDYDGVLDFIANETIDHKIIVRTLTDTMDDQALRSLLIGKYMHAKELKIDFSIDPESSMNNIPPTISRHELITILGNLIENAFDATRRSANDAKVQLTMSDFGDLIFEVEDSGPGVAPEMAKTIFERGTTTKTESDHGVGLYLVHQALLSLNGSVSIEQSKLGGARFTVIIPKLDEDSHETD